MEEKDEIYVRVNRNLIWGGIVVAAVILSSVFSFSGGYFFNEYLHMAENKQPVLKERGFLQPELQKRKEPQNQPGRSQPIKGTIKSKDSNTIVMSTQNDEIIVHVSPETNIVREQNKITLQELKVGNNINVLGEVDKDKKEIKAKVIRVLPEKKDDAQNSDILNESDFSEFDELFESLEELPI